LTLTEALLALSEVLLAHGEAQVEVL